MPTQDSSNSYGSVSRFNHWLGALLVLALLAIGLYFDGLPRGDARRFWRGLHIAIGTFASLFLLWRVFWRVRPKAAAPVPLHQPVALQLLSNIVHALLLAAIAVLAVTGPLSIWATGRAIPVLGWFSVPSPFPEFRALHEPLEEVHGFAADAILYLVGLHLLGVIKHQFISRDNILKRMAGRG
jgi:cytochrome b561